MRFDPKGAALAALVAILCARPPAGAQDAADPNEAALATRFSDAFETERWADAEQAWEQLASAFPAHRRNANEVFRSAFALASQPARRSEALARLDELLERSPDHVLALFLRARLRATGDAAERALAREDLLVAARNGFPALRELDRSREPWLRALRDDPRFVLRVLQAPREGPSGHSERDPFAPPRPGPGRGPEPVDPGTQRDLEARAESAFAKLEALGDRPEGESLRTLFATLREVMKDYAALEPANGTRIRERLASWRKRLARFEELFLALRHEADVAEANEHLAAMKRARDREAFDEGLARFEELRALVERMAREESEDSRLAAGAVLARGTAQRDELTRLKTLQGYGIAVTGIALDERAGGRSRAIIACDDPARRGRIYLEGERLRDRDGRRLDVTLVRIAPGHVVLRAGEVELVRALRSP